MAMIRPVRRPPRLPAAVLAAAVTALAAVMPGGAVAFVAPLSPHCHRPRTALSDTEAPEEDLLLPIARRGSRAGPDDPDPPGPNPGTVVGGEGGGAGAGGEEEDGNWGYLPGSADAFELAAQSLAEWTTASSLGAFLLQQRDLEWLGLDPPPPPPPSFPGALDGDGAASDAGGGGGDGETQQQQPPEGAPGGTAAAASEASDFVDADERLVRRLEERGRRWGGGQRGTAAGGGRNELSVVPLAGSLEEIMAQIELLDGAAPGEDEEGGGAAVASLGAVPVLELTLERPPLRPEAEEEAGTGVLPPGEEGEEEEETRLLRRLAEGRARGGSAAPRPPPPHPDLYRSRIERDRRRTALAIAASIDEDWQWRLFCEEGGGLGPLIECVRDGASSLRRRREGGGRPPGFLSAEAEEDYAAAVGACRNLRDLCALSAEFSAVVTDGILRADAARARERPGTEEKPGSAVMAGGVMSDLVTLLRYGQRGGLGPTFGSSAAAQSAAEGGGTSPGRRGGRLWRKLGLLKRTGKGGSTSSSSSKNLFAIRKGHKEARARSVLYIVQLFLAMAVASDDAIDVMRGTAGLIDSVVPCSSYAKKEQFRRRWVRYPLEIVKKRLSSLRAAARDAAAGGGGSERPFIKAASVGSRGISGEILRTSNMVLASIGHNVWVPKIPGQKGLRILCLDGGGSRGVTAIESMRAIVDAMGGIEVADTFDIIAGTSTGAIIAFLVGLRRETSEKAKDRYDKLIRRIFVKSATSLPMLVFTTASYDERHFNQVMQEVLGDTSMLESRADPSVPLVFAISSKMSSNPIKISLFRNYNYGGGELADSFTLNPEEAREKLGLAEKDDTLEHLDVEGLTEVMAGSTDTSGTKGSRHSGSFRILQRAALRATTAAPTFFKPVMMGGELYSDGGIVSSNPAAVAIHEARTLFPDVPIEMVVSCGTGGFVEERSPPKIGWDGIIGQIVNSATDGEQIHHILEDILGEGGMISSVSDTKYFRFNPVVGSCDEYPIDVTEPEKLARLADITKAYMREPKQQRKLREISDILEGKQGGLKKVLGEWTRSNGTEE